METNTALANFVRLNGGNDADVDLALTECEGMTLEDAIKTRLDYGMILNPEEVKAKVMAEAQQMFKDFVDYMNHDTELVMTEGPITDREAAEADVRIAADNLDYELQDCLIDLITDRFMNWLKVEGLRYI